MYIQNRRNSSKFKGCSPLKLLCNLKGNRPQSATFHTANRYIQYRANLFGRAGLRAGERQKIIFGSNK